MSSNIVCAASVAPLIAVALLSLFLANPCFLTLGLQMFSEIWYRSSLRYFLHLRYFFPLIAAFCCTFRSCERRCSGKPTFQNTKLQLLVEAALGANLEFLLQKLFVNVLYFVLFCNLANIVHVGSGTATVTTPYHPYQLVWDCFQSDTQYHQFSPTKSVTAGRDWISKSISHQVSFPKIRRTGNMLEPLQGWVPFTSLCLEYMYSSLPKCLLQVKMQNSSVLTKI